MPRKGLTMKAASPNGMLDVMAATNDAQHEAAGHHEQHELAGTDREPGALEEREQAALGVDLVDEPAGDADGALHDRRVLLDGRAEVDVALTPRQVEDVGELLLALVDAARASRSRAGRGPHPRAASRLVCISAGAHDPRPHGRWGHGPCGRGRWGRARDRVRRRRAP